MSGKKALHGFGVFFISLTVVCGSTDVWAATTQPLGDKGVMVNRQDVRGKINQGGPESWPENDGISTALPDMARQSKDKPASQPVAPVTEQAPIMVDPSKRTGTATIRPSASVPTATDTQKLATVPASIPVSGKTNDNGVASQSTDLPAPLPAPSLPQPQKQPAQIQAASGSPVGQSQQQADIVSKTSQKTETPVQQIPASVSAKSATKVEAPVANKSVDSRQENKPSSSVSGAITGKSVGLPVNAKPETVKDKGDQKEKEVQYVDEKGNPIEKPLELDKMLAEAERLINENKQDEALPVLEKLRSIEDITPEMREKVLYYISDCQWAHYADKPLAGFDVIVSSTNEAMNANLRSPRVPDALLRLGLANLNVGNLVDAGGYVVALFRRYPDYPGVAQGFAALGKEYLKQGRNAEAAKSFSVVLDKYPESSMLQTASVGLAQAFHRQKMYDKAHMILDFISKRWPRYYIDDPDFLLLQAGNDQMIQKTDAAMETYWLFINLDPSRKGNDDLLLKMGDIYLRDGNAAAEAVYHELQSRFPGTPAAGKAALRLAEKGIYESPVSYESMSHVFAKGTEPSLWQVYTDFINTSPEDPDAVLARLKKAMWLCWDKQYTESMGSAADFLDNFPDHADSGQARELIWQAFGKELENSLAEHNYGRILILWNGFPIVRNRYGEPDAKLRYALAQGYLERGDDQKAFELLSAFLKSPMDPDYGESAFSEFFNTYLKVGAWDKILDLGNIVSDWSLSDNLRKQLDYAMALSAQNLGLNGPALEMWKKLATRDDIPIYQRAYATLFLARDAEGQKDIRSAYDLNRKVIELFTKLQDERSDKADPQRIKEAIVSLMDICEVGNRVPEALEWVSRYSSYLDDASVEQPGLRFREARLYRKLGDANRAQALLEDVVRRFPESPFANAAKSELRTFEVSRDLQNYIGQ